MESISTELPVAIGTVFWSTSLWAQLLHYWNTQAITPSNPSFLTRLFNYYTLYIQTTPSVPHVPTGQSATHLVYYCHRKATHFLILFPYVFTGYQATKHVNCYHSSAKRFLVNFHHLTRPSQTMFIIATDNYAPPYTSLCVPIGHSATHNVYCYHS